MPSGFWNVAGKLRLAAQGIQKWPIKQPDTPQYSPFKKYLNVVSRK